MDTPYDAPIPGASGYATAALGAKTAYQNALARINAKRTSTLRQYGYLGDIDPNNGTVQNLRVDPYNQYGGLQQMLRGNAQSQQDAQFQAEERGLHGGLAHKAVSDVRYDLGNATQQLGTAFTGSLGGFQDEQNQAAYDRDRALYEAELQATRDALAAQMFNQADYTDTNYEDPTDNGNPSGSGGAAPSIRQDNSDALSRFIANRVKSPAKTSGLGGAAGAALLNPGKKQITTPAVVKAAIAAASKKKKGGK